MGKILDWTKRNKKALGIVAGGTAATTAMHLGFDMRAFDGQSLYDMTDSAIRAIPYLTTAVAYGRALEITIEGKRGYVLNPLEKIAVYGIGALAASGLWEGIENVSSIDAAYRMLHNTAEQIGAGDYIKQEFPGKGWETFNDAAKTVVGTQALVAGKEYLSRFARRFRRSEQHA